MTCAHAGWRASSAQHDTSKPSTSPTAQWMINTCIAVVFIILFVLYYGANLRARWQYRHIPGPRPRWLLGNTLPGMPGATRRMFYQWPRVYGSVYRLFLGRVPVVVVTDADLARAIAMKHFVKVCGVGSLLHSHLPCVCGWAPHHSPSPNILQFHDRPFVLAKLYDGQREEFMRAGTLFARCVCRVWWCVGCAYIDPPSITHQGQGLGNHPFHCRAHLHAQQKPHRHVAPYTHCSQRFGQRSAS